MVTSGQPADDQHEARPVDLGILLGVAYQEFVRELHRAHAAAGFADLGRSDGFVFRSLAIRPMTVSELASRLEITKQGAAQIIDDMERRGYVERRPDPDDRRAKLVRLSERGRRAFANARRFHQEYERDLARRHGADAVATLRAMLEAIAGAEQSVDPRLRAFYL
jgi:DNA-binding MarR family transcriptional regulator